MENTFKELIKDENALPVVDIANLIQILPRIFGILCGGKGGYYF